MSGIGAAPRLLVVTVDRLPAWILPPYGAGWVAMPTVTRLAARGVVFDDLVATSDDSRDTVRAMLAWLAGMPPERVAVVADDPAVVSAAWGGEATVVPVAMPAAVAADEAATNLGRLCATAATITAARRHDVVWCHASSLGLAWDAPDEFREAYLAPDDPSPPSGAAVPDLVVDAGTDPDLVAGLRHVFAGQLTLFDRRLCPLVDAAGDSYTILLVGLRGMPLGLHHRVGPGAVDACGELTHLPAILVDRAGKMAGQRFGGLVIPADLGATLAEAASRAAPPPAATDEPWRGRGLGGLLESWSAAGRDRVITVAATGVAVTTPGWRVVTPAAGKDGRARMFARPDDFFEQCDVADRSAAVCEELAVLAEAAARGRLAEAWATPLSAAAVRSG